MSDKDKLKKAQMQAEIDVLKRERVSREGSGGGGSAAGALGSGAIKVGTSIVRMLGGMRIRPVDSGITNGPNRKLYLSDHKAISPVPGGVHKLDKSSLIGHLDEDQPRPRRQSRSKRSNPKGGVDYNKMLENLRRFQR